MIPSAMSLAVNVLSCLSDTEDALTPLEIARWLINYDTDHEDDDEGDLKEEIEDELQSLVDNDLVVKSGRRYLITAQGILALAEATKKPRMFLVHGHDHVLLYKCKDLILKEFEGELDDIVILQDKPTRGSESLHDKLKRYAPTKGDLAVVLMTADDVGASRKEAGRPRPRARQNATFEMGLCYASIGRSRTWVLLDQGVELPSDVAGGMFIATDGNWMMQLRDGIRDVLDNGSDED